ncbi:hypothetical protein A2V49_02980 [candidate division WWE3 bacterium RBG_19FT_COMBO_34_6]|uniref:Phenylalanyl tRNA synthetase beta chain core domain-containing protein n=1 Tax=candidate division WWE3 bacterium RBG_19FT_COMBO_34_6 TaxID=1802612 RepID=A0A1F4UKZ1_UNCKA|nr:MAG: hypothetical protein A2V49_02980 [candidate division WWE3 bacterium RBG_19FT_COMBO_34_6]
MEAGQITLENSLSPQKNALRSNIKQSLSNVLGLYKKYGVENIFIFEIGNIYQQSKNNNRYEDYQEIAMLGIYYENTNNTASQNLNEIKHILGAILSNLGTNKYELTKDGEVLINNKSIGRIDINSIELDIDLLSKINLSPSRIVSELKNDVIENISLVIDRNKNFGPVYNFIKDFDPNITDMEVMEEYHGKEIEDNKKTILIKITYKTPETGEIRKQLFTQLKSKYGVIHRE